MADKPKKSAPKIQDIARATDAAAGNSRSIVITNRQMIKDPMMTEVSKLTGAEAMLTKSTDQTAAGPVTKKAKKIIPLSDQSADDKPVGTAPPTPKGKTPAELMAKQSTLTGGKTVDIMAPAANADSSVAASGKDSSAKQADKIPIKVVKSTDKSDKKGPEIKMPSDDKSDKPTSDQPKTDNPAKAEAAKPAPGDDVEPTVEPKLDVPGKTVITGASTIDLEEDKAAKDAEAATKEDKPEPGQLTQEQQKAIEDGTYFLPIRTAESRRIRREILLSIIFVIILTLVWLDIMLDAGLLKLGNIHPVTHFFNM